MSFDLFYYRRWYRRIDQLYPSGGSSNTNAVLFVTSWDDDEGFAGYGSAFSAAQPWGYSIGNLDGSVDVRNRASFSNNTVVPTALDTITPGTRIAPLRHAVETVGADSWRRFTLYRHNPVIGTNPRNGLDLALYWPTDFRVRYALPGGVYDSDVRLLGRLEDRLLFLAARLDSLFRYVYYFVGSIPLGSTDIETLTEEFRLADVPINPLSVGFYSDASARISLGNELDTIWVSVGRNYEHVFPEQTFNGQGVEVVHYNVATSQVLRRGYISPTPPDTQGVWSSAHWSRKHNAFVLAGDYFTGLASLQVEPVHLSNPELVSGDFMIGKGTRIRARATGNWRDKSVYLQGEVFDYCEGTEVSWSTNAAGSFSPQVSVCDALGYAYTTYYPAAGSAGSHTLTATVVHP